MNMKERYTATLVPVNGTVALTGTSIGGFLAKTAGTVTVTNASGAVVVDAHPVSAGLYYPMPFLLGSPAPGGTFTCAGGASGTLAT